MLLAGKFTRHLETGTTLGHAGAIVNKDRGSYGIKKRMLQSAGVSVVHEAEEVVAKVKQVL